VSESGVSEGGRKRVLFVIAGLPRAGATANEDLDLLLVAAAFDVRPAVLFTGDGVHHLVRAANAPALGLRDVGRAYEALPTYDVERIYVDRVALDAAGLPSDALTLPVELLEPDAVRDLVARHDVVFTG
jgi:sulfur relay protein TusC/DsrF